MYLEEERQADDVARQRLGMKPTVIPEKTASQKIGLNSLLKRVRGIATTHEDEL
ncbi:hypothetical protein LCGC14_2401340 [marine sediment metagenome]|uniref:Uncharacterized protein n=1 Tax=marine sediment metagenome TaxID=412755 RepID=A0A0F9BVD0_9ZZZZ